MCHIFLCCSLAASTSTPPTPRSVAHQSLVSSIRFDMRQENGGGAGKLASQAGGTRRCCWGWCWCCGCRTMQAGDRRACLINSTRPNPRHQSYALLSCQYRPTLQWQPSAPAYTAINTVTRLLAHAPGNRVTHPHHAFNDRVVTYFQIAK